MAGPTSASGNDNPVAVVSTPTAFHMYDLARQLVRRGVLGRLHTALPRSQVGGIERPRIRTHPTAGAFTALNRFLPLPVVSRTIDRAAIVSFDHAVARRLEVCDIFHVLSRFGSRSTRVAKSRGAAVVVDRGSSHIAFQRRLLLAEHERWNLGWTPTPDWIVEREEAEYEIADRILVPSTFALESFVECGVDEAKIRVVPYGVDLRLFHPAAKHDDVFRVIFVGQLSVRKGLPDLLDALTPILTSKLELWLVGPNAPETASILRRSPGSYVVVGPVPRAKLHWYISQASVLVLPSIEEGMALVQAQALACGVPIIGTHNSGASDLIGNSGAGSVIAIHDPAAIRGAVLELRDRPDLQASQADAALRRAAALAGWGVYGERIVDVYREVVA